MKILLTAVNAKYIHSNPAVYSLRAYAGEYRKFIEIAEYTTNQKNEYILQEIYKKKPDVLCFSCYIWNYDCIREIAAEFHKLMPDVPVWAGGPEVSYEAERTLAETPSFYGIMTGEGEASFAQLAAHYCTGTKKELLEIPGLVYRKEKAGQTVLDFFRTARRKPLDFSEIPFCYENMKDFKNRIVYYESSRGCPFSCSYCLSSIDKNLRFRSMELVRKELLFFIENKVPQVKFVDRTFNCNHTHAMEIWRFLKEHDRGITNFHFEIAADLLTKEELSFLSGLRPGMVQFEIGVQSVNPKTLKEIHRNMHLPAVHSAVDQILKSGNIHVHLDLIAGLPFESYRQFAESFREIYAWKPDNLQLGFLKVLKGSYLYEHAKEYGMIYWDRPPYEIMRTKWISYEEILRIKLVEEMLEVYYNSGQYEVTMKILDAAYPDSFDFFLSLGMFYEKNELLKQNHSRIQRAKYLLDFLMEDKKVPKDLIEESLLFDLYYRENIKSRPCWAKNPSEWKAVAKAFCKNGKMSHIEPFSYHFPKKEERTVSHFPKKLAEQIYVLFEYEKRDALTHQAQVTEFTNQEVKEKCRNVQKKF